MTDKIKEALAFRNISETLPQDAVVACQGTEGAYSQYAYEKLFTGGTQNIMYFESFSMVFNAVNKGMCRYGILPLENSLQGSVTEVYDLMHEHSFHIVRSAKVKIDHALLANHGSFAPGIVKILSHEQALAQCSGFIRNLKNVKIEKCANTAVAARSVSQSGRTDIAAIANLNCAGLYNLSVLSRDIQNNPNNYTRFICISKELEIYPHADKISIMFTLPHKPGSLYEFIGKFANIGVNLAKLESRPIPGSDFEFMFYAEMDAAIGSEGILELFKQLSERGGVFTFLGNYAEV